MQNTTGDYFFCRTLVQFALFYVNVIRVQQQFYLTSTARQSGLNAKIKVLIHRTTRHIDLPPHWYNVKRRVYLTLAVSLSTGAPVTKHVN